MQLYLLSMGSGPSINCAMSSIEILVSSIEAFIPGSRFRSVIDMRLGDRAGLLGDMLPGGAWDEDRTGTG